MQRRSAEPMICPSYVQAGPNPSLPEWGMQREMMSQKRSGRLFSKEAPVTWPMLDGAKHVRPEVREAKGPNDTALRLKATFGESTTAQRKPVCLYPRVRSD